MHIVLSYCHIELIIACCIAIRDYHVAIIYIASRNQPTFPVDRMPMPVALKSTLSVERSYAKNKYIAVLHSYFAMEMSRIDRGNDSLIDIIMQSENFYIV